MTLNGVMAIICVISPNSVAVGAQCVKTVEDVVVKKFDFDEISRVRTSFQKALDVKILIDFLSGLRSYGGFKLRGSGSPKFSAPRSGETMRRTPESFRDGRTCSRSSITMPSLVWLHIRPTPKTFFCLSIRHAVERQSLCARFRHEGVGVQKRF